MRKKDSKQSKVSRIDRNKALAAQADEAIKERIRTAPAAEGSDTMLHRQRASRV